MQPALRLSEEIDAVAIAQAFVARLASGDFAAAVAHFGRALRDELPQSALQATWDALVARVGPLESRGAARADAGPAGARLVRVPLRFSCASLVAEVCVDAGGTLSGIFVVAGSSAQEWQPPGYAQPTAFTERSLRVGRDAALGATLTLARTSQPAPLVLLVHGSGQLDRDVSIGPNKLFKDLAWGLASRGVSVLRYDKRSYVDGVDEHANWTVEREVLLDALDAARRLRAIPELACDRPFLLGHSLGGYLAPMILERDAGFAGVVLLAASSRSVDQLVVEQAHHILAAEAAIYPSGVERLQQMLLDAAELEALRRGATPSRATLLGAPIGYWRGLIDYDPCARLEVLALPALVLRGARDYQVGAEDFAGWQRALGPSGACFRVYPALNHLLMPGEGVSQPSEYWRPGHVDVAVIDDIAQFVLGSARGGGGRKGGAPILPRRGRDELVSVDADSEE